MTAPRLAVVSYAAHDPFSPRATRTRAIVGVMEGAWSVEVHASEVPLRIAPQSKPAVRALRGMLRRTAERTMLDKHERWSRAKFRRWSPEVDAAVLIGLPVSPLVYAGERLRMREIPYVVDLGDPWVLTHPDPMLRWPAAARAARAERLLWQGASGAIVTTEAVGQALGELLPGMPILVRPNGYDVVTPTAASEPAGAGRARDELRLIHFGGLGAARIDIALVLRRLSESGRWRQVTLAQYGSDWGGVLDSVPAGVDVARHAPVPWEEAVTIARRQDAVIVVGNRSSFQMPSKAVQSLTLPIPRIALTNGEPDDALTRYVADKPGWLAVPPDDPDLAGRIEQHVATEWNEADLAPPPGEAWPNVAAQLHAFIDGVLPRPAQATGTVATSEDQTDVRPTLR